MHIILPNTPIGPSFGNAFDEFHSLVGCLSKSSLPKKPAAEEIKLH
jgi:hypothetical protein